MTEKEKLEIAAAKIFCNCFQKETGIYAKFLRPNDPPLPDSTCKIGNDEIDIEIAHVYGSDTDAQRLLGRKRRVAFDEEILKEQRRVPLNLRIPNTLNYILENKSKKSYKTDKVWLVIRNAYPLWSKKDFQTYKSEIIIPEIHPFEKIWLICDSSGYSGLIEL